jgi:hypothetical protein
VEEKNQSNSSRFFFVGILILTTKGKRADVGQALRKRREGGQKGPKEQTYQQQTTNIPTTNNKQQTTNNKRSKQKIRECMKNLEDKYAN